MTTAHFLFFFLNLTPGSLEVVEEEKERKTSPETVALQKYRSLTPSPSPKSGYSGQVYATHLRRGRCLNISEKPQQIYMQRAACRFPAPSIQSGAVWRGSHGRVRQAPAPRLALMVTGKPNLCSPKPFSVRKNKHGSSDNKTLCGRETSQPVCAASLA